MKPIVKLHIAKIIDKFDHKILLHKDPIYINQDRKVSLEK